MRAGLSCYGRPHQHLGADDLQHLLMVIAIAALPTFVLSAIKATFGLKIL